MNRLRQYEEKARADVLALWARGVRRVLLVMPTGGGKTVVAADIIRDESGPVLFLAHRRELIDQAVERLVELGVPREDIGVIMRDDARTNPTARIQVASVATLHRRALPPAGLVVVDEAHHAVTGEGKRGAQMYAKILPGYPEARVLGLTATPERLDGKGLRGSFDELQVAATPSQLIEGGWISRPSVWTHPKQKAPELAGVRTSGGDYNVKDLARVVRKSVLVGDMVEHYRRRARGKPAVLFAVNRALSKRYVEAFGAAGIAAEHLDGETPVAERKAILARLRSGKTKVVSNVGVLTEGWDASHVRCAILARPTKSLTLYLQMVGRILRPYVETRGRFVGQTLRPIVLDHAGNHSRHGLPEEDHAWSLDGRRKKRGGAPTTRACLICGAVMAFGAHECSECGTVFPVDRAPAEQEGELREVRPLSPEEREAQLGKIVAFAERSGARNPRAFAQRALEAGVRL